MEVDGCDPAFLCSDTALFLLTPNYKYLIITEFNVLLPRMILHFFPLCPILTAMMLYRLLPDWRTDATPTMPFEE